MTGETATSYVELVHTMGTVVTLDVRAASRPAGLAAAFADAEERLHRLDALLSTWQDDSWASRLLRGAVTVAACPSEVRDVVLLAKRLAGATGGYFSPYWRGGPALGPVGTATGPDATGLVKGWAAQRASDVLLAHGLVDHVVNAAGDLVLSGSPAPGIPGSVPPWRVGISDPVRPGTFAGVLELVAAPDRWALATSGPAERGPHVVDPHTGARPTSIASATAVARVGEPDVEAGGWSDGCATALVAAGGRAAGLLDRLAADRVRCLLIHADGRVTDPHRLLRPLDPAGTGR